MTRQNEKRNAEEMNCGGAEWVKHNTLRCFGHAEKCKTVSLRRECTVAQFKGKGKPPVTEKFNVRILEGEK